MLSTCKFCWSKKFADWYCRCLIRDPDTGYQQYLICILDVRDSSPCHTGMAAQCGAGKQFIVAENAMQPFTWESAGTGCTDIDSGWSLIKRVPRTISDVTVNGVRTHGYSADCLERTIFSQINTLFPMVEEYFWTGICSDSLHCTLFHRDSEGLSQREVPKSDPSVGNRFLLCESGKDRFFSMVPCDQNHCCYENITFQFSRTWLFWVHNIICVMVNVYNITWSRGACGKYTEGIFFWRLYCTYTWPYTSLVESPSHARAIRIRRKCSTPAQAGNWCAR